jgi:hypothetical protein
MILSSRRIGNVELTDEIIREAIRRVEKAVCPPAERLGEILKPIPWSLLRLYSDRFRNLPLREEGNRTAKRRVKFVLEVFRRIPGVLQRLSQPYGFQEFRQLLLLAAGSGQACQLGTRYDRIGSHERCGDSHAGDGSAGRLVVSVLRRGHRLPKSPTHDG